MAEPNTIYKLMILYMLENVEFPLTNTQISNFFLEREYTDYFTVQKAIFDLIDSELIRFEITPSNTQYQATAAGLETLNLLRDKISISAREDVKAYFSEKKMEFKTRNSMRAEYYKMINAGYAVHCQIKESSTPLLDLTLQVRTKEQAEFICKNWNHTSAEVYELLMDTLLQ